MIWYERWVMGSDFYEFIESGEIAFAPSPVMTEDGTNYVLGRMGEIWLGNGSANREGALAYLSCLRLLDMNKEVSDALREWFDLPANKLTDEMRALLKEMDDPNNFKPLLCMSRGIGDWGYSQTGVLDMYSMAAQFENPWPTLVEQFYPILQEQIDIANKRVSDQ